MNYIKIIFKWIMAVAVSALSPLLVIGIIYLYKFDKLVVDSLVPSLGREDLGLASMASFLITLLIFGICAYLLCPGNPGNTNHTCNICKATLKIGEGKHFPKRSDDSCYCICDKCLPTCDLSRLIK